MLSWDHSCCNSRRPPCREVPFPWNPSRRPGRSFRKTDTASYRFASPRPAYRCSLSTLPVFFAGIVLPKTDPVQITVAPSGSPEPCRALANQNASQNHELRKTHETHEMPESGRQGRQISRALYSLVGNRSLSCISWLSFCVPPAVLPLSAVVVFGRNMLPNPWNRERGRFPMLEWQGPGDYFARPLFRSARRSACRTGKGSALLYFESNFLPALRLSKLRIVLNTMK